MINVKQPLLVLLMVIPVAGLAKDPLGISAMDGGFEYVTSVEGIHEYRLPNGLQVLLFPNPAQARITVNVTYRVGSMHENYGETGMAHLLEHMLFKGTPDHANIPQEFAERGMQFNATTSVDRTNYFATFERSRSKLEWTLRLEADRMVNSYVAYEDLQSEFSVVRNEMERGEDSPGRMLNQRVRAAAYEWHNYGKTTIGARSDVEGVDISRLQAFYRMYYQPDNATLIIAGDFKPAETAAIIADSFGAIPAPDRELPRIYTTEPTQDGERLITLRRVGEQGSVMAAYHIPAGGTLEHVALGVITRILSDFNRGRLYRKLVVPGIAAGAGASADSSAYPGLFALSATPPEDGDVESVLDALIEVAEGISKDPITEEELEWARLAMSTGYENTLNSVGSLAQLLSESIAGGDWRYLFLFKDQLDAITVDDLNAAAVKHFTASNRTAGIFVPTKKPKRAEILPRADQSELLAALAGRESVSSGEIFTPTAENIDSRTITHDLAGGGSLWTIEKKARGDQIIFSLNLFYGSEDSLAGHHGVEQFAGSQLQRGTKRYSRDELATKWNRLKSGLSVGAGGQMVRVTLGTDEENFDEALDLMAHVLRNPVFSTRELAEYKRSALASLAGSRGQPQSMVSIALAKITNPYGPGHFRYAMDLDEREKMIRGIKRDALVEFWNTHTGFEGALAAAVGNFDSAALAARLNELFGDWTAVVPYVPTPDMHHPARSQYQWLDTPDKANGIVRVVLPIPLNVRDEDYPALSIGSRIFSGSGMSGRLQDRLRQKEGWSYSAGGGIAAASREGSNLGSISIQAIAAPENLAKVKTAIFEELQRALNDGFTAKELEDVVDGTISANVSSWSSDMALMGMLRAAGQYGINASWQDAMHKRYEGLTVEEVNSAFRKYYKLDDFIIMIGGDQSKAEL